MSLKICGSIILILLAQLTYCQTEEEQAHSKAIEAVRLEDKEGKFDEAIKFFEEAAKLDPDNIDYPYEIAYAYSWKKDYKKASEILEKLLNHKDVNGQVYQALGNSYDYQDKPDKALDTYERGVKKFPNSGELYLELGNMNVEKKDYNAALAYYEKGIEKDPEFPSNYYWASRIFCGSSESVWGLIYGEIFMNLERNSKRNEEISGLLYNTYKSKIKINGDSAGIDFCDVVINADDLKDKDHIKFPFCMVFGQDFILSITLEKLIDIASLNSIRKKFIEFYFENGHDKTHPNLLYDYQNRIIKSGNFEAYNYWILNQGDKKGFESWRASNKEKWDDFIKWFTNNPIEIDSAHKFYRSQY